MAVRFRKSVKICKGVKVNLLSPVPVYYLKVEGME